MLEGIKGSAGPNLTFLLVLFLSFYPFYCRNSLFECNMKFVRSLRFHDEINSPTTYEVPWHELQIKQFLVESSFFWKLNCLQNYFHNVYISRCVCADIDFFMTSSNN